jgi:hypothetical protein
MESKDPFSLPLLDETDIEILMHKDVHFSGNFALMVEYYKKKRVGALSEFPLKKILKLEKIQANSQQDLSEQILPEAAKAEIEDAKKMYLELRDLYENKESSPMAVAIADLIFSEEDEPKAEMDLIISYGSNISPLLINLITTDNLYNPLYPGYGRAPIFAAYCLEKIQDLKAITPLFQMLGRHHAFADEAFIYALVSFKDQAREFLLKRLALEPFGKDNEHAAIVLTSMPDDELTSKRCLNLLHHPLISKHLMLANYLIIGCAGLKDPKDQAEFKKIKDQIPGIMKHEADMILNTWY